MTNFEGIDVLCVVGGDGTFHEVVNGLMQHPIAHIAPHSIPALSVIPAGTGNSMARELQGISSVRVCQETREKRGEEKCKKRAKKRKKRKMLA